MYKLEDVATFDKLFAAHLRARCCKRHKKEVVLFEVNLAQNLMKIENDLKNGTYKIKGYKRFMIYDPKEREIQALDYYDRIVQNSLCYNFLIPFYTKKLIYDNSACRKFKGTHFARKRLEGFIHNFYKKHKQNGYFLKIDVKKYFNNINHDILKQKLGDIYDVRLKNLVYQIIDSYSHHSDVGVPMGNQSSQIFALLYLNEIDRLIKEKYKIKYYCRYMDDLIIIHNDKELLKKLFADIRFGLEKLKLEANHKSEIIALKNGVEFLGVRYKLLKNGKLIKKIKRQSKKRMIQRLKILKTGYKFKLLSKEDVVQSLAGFKGNIKDLTVYAFVKKRILPLVNICKPNNKNNYNKVIFRYA